MLKGKTVILGVTGSIAAYKIAGLASRLVKLGADVHVIMTEHAMNFVNPITFETLTNNKCLVDTFDRNFQFHVAHVSLAQKADVMLVAPASANIIAKMAYGIADDMLSTTALAMKGPVIVAPAMNVNMFNNPTVQDNIRRLYDYGKIIIPPENGYLACGTTGAGKLPSEEVLLDYILREIACEKDLKGRKVLVTAGPTREALDPVRFITNHSTGKMGYALAKNAARRGAQTVLVTGPVSLPAPLYTTVAPVTTAQEMYEAVDAHFDTQDLVIMSAAVADYRPRHVAAEKIKKKDSTSVLELERTADILANMSKRKNGQFLCGFSMETEHMLENSRAKLEKKNLDMIVANSLRMEGAGFGTDTNIITMITKNEVRQLEKMSKDAAAQAVFDEILRLL